MLYPKTMITAAKGMWVKKYFDPTDHVWKQVSDELLKQNGGGSLLFKSNYNPKYPQNVTYFNKEVLGKS